MAIVFQRSALFGLMISTALSAPALAKVSAQVAAQLGGPVLTEFGAKKAGNADGSIPAYTGGLGGVPPGVNPGNGFPADPFASEKPLYTITSANVDQYASQLAAGTAALVRKTPGFKVEVYPTHRTAYYPDWVLKNTLKNATTAELTGPVEGDGVKNAYGGIPFPIPQNGFELLWNNNLRWAGVHMVFHHEAGIFVDSSGHRTLTDVADTDAGYLYYDPERTSVASDAVFEDSINKETAPASADGNITLIQYPLNYGEYDQAIYTYTVGQRRIRLAPEFKYDTPVATSGGAFTYDEINLFAGRADKFNFKIAGQKELIIPYNIFKINQPSTTQDEAFLPHTINPDYLRWEKHRVWVLEATLKPGQRDIYSRRTYYIDEDTWAIVTSDAYDQAGRLYRVGYDFLTPIYNVPDPFTFGTTFAFYDIDQGSYYWQGYQGAPYYGDVREYHTMPSLGHFSPETVAGSGIR